MEKLEGTIFSNYSVMTITFQNGKVTEGPHQDGWFEQWDDGVFVGYVRYQKGTELYVSKKPNFDTKAFEDNIKTLIESW